MSKEVRKEFVVTEKGNIFRFPFLIPIYQRPFGWTEKEILELIDDIQSGEGEYCLGSLVIKKEGSRYHVIDGQQRLTALYLLLSYLGYPLDSDSLKYECREKSNHTLKELPSYIEKGIVDEDMDASLLSSFDIIKRKFVIDGIEKKEFKERLKSTFLFLIEVPPKTDLNRYFEIMNTRGEQLENTDILKARLMDAIDSESDKEAFSLVWNACRDMDGYVEMHFGKDNRETLFGESWANEPSIDRIRQLKNDEKEQFETVLEIINKGGESKKEEGFAEEKESRFKGFISFEQLLLYSLSVEYGSKTSLKNRLVENFEEASGGFTDDFSLKFIVLLLKCRLLYDKYFLKRDFGENDGDWSLKELVKSGGDSYYRNTSFNDDPDLHQRILMLEECLRVSYTSPSSMNWIPECLGWLYGRGKKDISEFEKKLEGIIQKPVKAFLNAKDYEKGTSTPHIVFNYLDYLLWKKNKEEFDFKFTNSVEHWYPRNPGEGKRKWEHIDAFGNLCLISVDTNSKFSNLQPEFKLGQYKEMIATSSLKLREMAEITQQKGWTEDACKKHQDKMIGMLKAACK